jgi:hypothetical protein
MFRSILQLSFKVVAGLVAFSATGAEIANQPRLLNLRLLLAEDSRANPPSSLALPRNQPVESRNGRKLSWPRDNIPLGNIRIPPEPPPPPPPAPSR